MQINLHKFSTIKSIDRLFTMGEEDIIKMPPKKKYKVHIIVKSIRRGAPSIAGTDDVIIEDGYEKGYKRGYEEGYYEGRWRNRCKKI